MRQQRLLIQVAEVETEGGEGGAGEEVQRGQLEGGVDGLTREQRVEVDEELHHRANKGQQEEC